METPLWRAKDPKLAQSVYVHFPYCAKKCPYCDFVSYARDKSAIDGPRYARAVCREIEARKAAFEGRIVHTVFFGGGTPSLWEAEALGSVLAAIKKASKVVSDLEVTVECNPSSLDEDHARRLVDQGVNRLSIGVQGLDKRRLAFLGRWHDPDEGLAALRAAVAASVPRVSADLIYGVAGGRRQSPKDAADEVRRVAATGVRHLSAYALTIEPETRFGQLASKGELPVASDDALADSFSTVDEALAEVGFSHYEVSNFAHPGEEARHNLSYWRGYPYVGLGCAAMGTLSGAASALRYRNHRRPDVYLEAVEKLDVGAATDGSIGPNGAVADLQESEEWLDAETQVRERLMLGLRVADGVDLAEAERALGIDPWPEVRSKRAAGLIKDGRLAMQGRRVWVPRSSWLFADGIAAQLF